MDGHVVTRVEGGVEQQKRQHAVRNIASNPVQNLTEVDNEVLVARSGRMLANYGSAETSGVDAPGTLLPVNEQEQEDEGIKYGAQHVIKLFTPVSLCMLVVVTTINAISFYSKTDVYL